jgi:3-oxoacyl-[acyl-carrier-protein] synthase-3
VRPVCVDGISYRHGTWHDLDHLTQLDPPPDGLPIDPAAVATLAAGGLCRYSAIERPVHELFEGCVQQTLDASGVQPAEVDAVIFFSSTFSSYTDYDDVARLCAELGIRQALPMGMFLGQCTNYSSALLVAAALIDSHGFDNVLLVSADALDERRASRVLARTIAVFSDTVASCLVSRSARADRGYRVEHITHRFEPGLVNLDPETNLLKFVTLFSGALDRVCADLYVTLGCSGKDFSRLVLANFTIPTLKNFAMAAGIPVGRMYTENLARFGHCFAADQLIALDTLSGSGVLRAGDRLLALGVGGNYLFSATTFEKM